MLPLFTAFLTKADYGIVGMVVTVTTFLDVFVTLGFDVAFTRFYFDDKSPRAPQQGHHPRLLRRRLYPADPARRARSPSCRRSRSLLMGGSGYTMLLRHRRRDALLHQPQRPAVHAAAPRAPAVDLHLLHHRPRAHPGAHGGRLPRRLPLGPDGRTSAPTSSRADPAQPRRAADLRPQAPLALGRAADARDARLRHPGASSPRVSFFFLKLSDRFFLLHYQGKAEVGLYTVANSLSQPLYIVGMAFRMAWPQWHYAKLNEPEKHKRMVARSSTYFMALNALLLVLVGAYLPLVDPRAAERALLVHRADDVRAHALGRALQPVLHLLDRRQRRQEEPPDPGDHADRLGRQHRPQLPARPEVRHVRGGLDDGDRLRASSPCSSTSSRNRYYPIPYEWRAPDHARRRRRRSRSAPPGRSGWRAGVQRARAARRARPAASWR